MKVTFITSNHYLDTAVPLINALSNYADMIVIVDCLNEQKKLFFTCGKQGLEKSSVIEVSGSKINELPGYASLLQENNKKIKVVFVFHKNFKILSLNAWANMREAKKYLDNAEYIHIQSLTARNYFMVNKKNNKKIIIDIHDVIQHSGIKLSFWSKFIVNQWLRAACEIIVHNSSCVDYMENVLKLPKAKINILPFGQIHLTAKKQEVGINPERPTLLFFGRICRYKGIEYLIEAVDTIRKKIPNLKVIIAGEDKSGLVASKVKDCGTYEIINKYIPNEQLAELLSKSTIVVCPYTDATQSGVLMTALTFNKPVVATNVGGFPEIIENGITGVLVPPKDSQRLASAITDLLTDSGKLNRISENIRKKISQENYSWDYIARKTMDVYKKH